MQAGNVGNVTASFSLWHRRPLLCLQGETGRPVVQLAATLQLPAAACLAVAHTLLALHLLPMELALAGLVVAGLLILLPRAAGSAVEATELPARGLTCGCG